MGMFKHLRGGVEKQEVSWRGGRQGYVWGDIIFTDEKLGVLMTAKDGCE